MPPQPSRGQFAKDHSGEIDAVFAYRDFLLVAGWLDTFLERTSAHLEIGSIEIDLTRNLFQYYRDDVAKAVGGSERARLAFAALRRTKAATAGANVTFRADGYVRQKPAIGTRNAAEFLEMVLGVLSQAAVQEGSPAVLYSLPAPFLGELTALYRLMLDEQSLPAFNLRSPSSGEPVCSLAFVQCGPIPLLPIVFQSMRSIASKIELIVVNNSRAFRQATLMTLTEAKLLHAIDWQYIEPELNIGFGPACNMAARAARGDVVVFHNNDVFTPNPGDYERIIDAARAEPRTVVGARQFFPNGGLMHDGLQVGLLDPAVTGGEAGIFSGLSRGRGAVPGRMAGPVFTSGSLLGIGRQLFLSVGGFSEDYLYGHFEDLDLCMRLHAGGTATDIVRDVQFIHCEGSGSAVPQYIASTVPTLNRMTFNRSWAKVARQWLEAQ